MRYLATVGYWTVVMVVIAMIMVSFGYTFSRAMFLGSLYLPALLCLRLMIPQINFKNRKEAIRDTLLIAAGVTILTILLTLIAHISDEYYAYCNIPSPIINPIFTVIVLVATSLPQLAIEQWFNKRQVQFPQEIEFISDRRKVKVMMSEIAYVESNDSEVWLHLNNGLTHRTKTTISQWSSMLDNGNFIRIHRSYLVNQQAISAHDASFVTILDQRLPISRKYKDSVQQYLASAE